MKQQEARGKGEVGRIGRKHVLGKGHNAAHEVRELQEGWCWRGKEVQVGTAGQEPMGHAGCPDFIPGPQALGHKNRCAL